MLRKANVTVAIDHHAAPGISAAKCVARLVISCDTDRESTARCLPVAAYRPKKSDSTKKPTFLAPINSSRS